MPIVPYLLDRQESIDDSALELYRKNRRNHSESRGDSESERSERESSRSRRHRSSRRRHGSDSEGSHSDHSAEGSHNTGTKIPRLYELLEVMTCDAEFLESLATLKILIKKSDLV